MVVEPVEQVDVKEKEEEQVKSLAEVLFADEINEQKESVSRGSQKSQSDALHFRGANLLKDGDDEGSKPSIRISGEALDSVAESNE